MVNVKIPNDPKAIAAYESGKQFYYGKKGQLNLACADCHVYSSGQFVRGNLLSPALGHVTHFPVFRGSWAKKRTSGDGLGTLHARFGGCMKQVRARPMKPQGDEFRNMEYFMSYMSNGLPINAPGYRE
jgi:sulfur-oxidizing protein SoxA